MKRITPAEFEEIKEKTRDALGGKVDYSLRYHGKSGAKYARGMMDISPRGKRDWTLEEFDMVLAWMRGAGLVLSGTANTPNYYANKSGLNYLIKSEG